MEKTNRIDDSNLAAVLAEMRLDMLKWFQQTADLVPYDMDARFTPEMMWARCRSLVPEDHQEEVLRKIGNGISFPALMQCCRELANGR